jgi:ubiquinone/menaquinone biosynthesis C-methylase UbiE
LSLFTRNLGITSKFFSVFGFNFCIFYERIREVKGKNLNLGCGTYLIKGFDNLDYSNSKNKKIIQWDARKQKLPYKSNSIDNIYVSHFIEHIDDKDAKFLFLECHRVLKKNGTFRISYPNANFLFNISIFKNDYFYFLDKYKKSSFKRLIFLLSDLFLDFEKSYFQTYKKAKIFFFKKDYKKFIKLLINYKFEFRKGSNHISIWDFKKIEKISYETKFRHVIDSKRNLSVSPEMRGVEFDRSHPEISSYVDIIK